MGQNKESGDKENKLPGKGQEHGVLAFRKALEGGNKDDGRADQGQAGAEDAHTRNSDGYQAGIGIEYADKLGSEDFHEYGGCDHQRHQPHRSQFDRPP